MKKGGSGVRFCRLCKALIWQRFVDSRGSRTWIGTHYRSCVRFKKPACLAVKRRMKKRSLRQRVNRKLPVWPFCCPHCDNNGDHEKAYVLQCPGCGRDGCPECIPAGRGCVCPECEEAG